MSVSRIHPHLLLAQCSWIHEALLAGRLHKRSCHGAEIQWEFNRRRKTRSINCALLWLVSEESAIFSSQTPPVWFNISISLLKYTPSVQLPYTLFLALSLVPWYDFCLLFAANNHEGHDSPSPLLATVPPITKQSTVLVCVNFCHSTAPGLLRSVSSCSLYTHHACRHGSKLAENHW